MIKLLILDTETTGLSLNDEPIEIALLLIAISLNGDLIQNLTTYCGLREPSVPINPHAQKVHGIKSSDVCGKQWNHKLISELIDSADILVAHNAEFDARMLKTLYPEIMNKNWRCTYRQWPWPETVNKKLSNAANLMKINVENKHRALDDAELLKACLFSPTNDANYCSQLLNAGPYIFKMKKTNSSFNFKNALQPEIESACSELIGLINGLKADHKLVDEEIVFLKSWILAHPELEFVWPVTEVIQILYSILEDSIVTDDERSKLSSFLEAVGKSSFKIVANAARSDSLIFDEIEEIIFQGKRFCLTGNFLYGDKDLCASKILENGGEISGNVSKKIDFLIVGSLGSADWKNGNFGTKIEKAIEYRSTVSSLKIIHEEIWTYFLKMNLAR